MTVRENGSRSDRTTASPDKSVDLPDGQITDSCPAPLRKIFRFSAAPNHLYKSRHPVPHRGAFRDRHGRWARDAVDAAASGARIARGRMTLDLRTAKSCGPDAPTLASSLRDFPKATVAKEPGHRGARSKPLKPLRRESWVFR